MQCGQATKEQQKDQRLMAGLDTCVEPQLR